MFTVTSNFLILFPWYISWSNNHVETNWEGLWLDLPHLINSKFPRLQLMVPAPSMGQPDSVSSFLGQYVPALSVDCGLILS